MNAKRELHKHLDSIPKPWYTIRCVEIIIEDEFSDRVSIYLKFGYTAEEFREFIDELDFDYCNGFGGQYLFGTIWYNDGTWSERGEYDGSEWWEYKAVPEIPKECKRDV